MGLNEPDSVKSNCDDATRKNVADKHQGKLSKTWSFMSTLVLMSVLRLGLILITCH